MSDDARLARSTAAWDGDAAGAATPLGEAPTVDGRPPGLRVGSTTLADRRYQLLGELGRGGMAVVHAAIDRQLGRRVALKLVRPDRVDAAGRARLLREAKAMARLQHRNVVQVYDAGSVGDQVFVAMELVDGGSLQRWLVSALPADAVRDAAAAVGGHATRFKASQRTPGVFAPLSAPLARIHHELKRAFDPARILNRGRLYPDL